MPVPTDGQLLDTWERASGLDHPARAATLASALSDERLPVSALDMPIGRRDATLFDVRRVLFGSILAATVRCPRCQEMVELDVDLGAILPAAPKNPSDTVDVTVGDWNVAVRPPTSADLIAVAADPTPIALLGRCIVAVQHAGERAEVGSLPGAVVDEIEAAIAAADPAADIQLELSCAACGIVWSAPFDIATFLAAELDAWARATVREVAALGRAYGWTEPESLALTPERRRLYVELAAS
jgi:hypothetical protein